MPPLTAFLLSKTAFLLHREGRRVNPALLQRSAAVSTYTTHMAEHILFPKCKYVPHLHVQYASWKGCLVMGANIYTKKVGQATLNVKLAIDSMCHYPGRIQRMVHATASPYLTKIISVPSWIHDCRVAPTYGESNVQLLEGASVGHGQTFSVHTLHSCPTTDWVATQLYEKGFTAHAA